MASELTPEDVDAMVTRADAASPLDSPTKLGPSFTLMNCSWACIQASRQSDLDFWFHARTDLPRLADDWRRLRAELADILSPTHDPIQGKPKGDNTQQANAWCQVYAAACAAGLRAFMDGGPGAIRVEKFITHLAAENKRLIMEVFAAESAKVEWQGVAETNFAENAALRKQVEATTNLISDLDDPDPCEYDHHGYCQSHSLAERPCPHELAKELLGRRAEK